MDTELREFLGALNQSVSALDQRLVSLDARMVGIDEHLVSLDARMAAMDERLVTVDAHLVSLDQQATTLKEDVNHLLVGQNAIRADQQDMKSIQRGHSQSLSMTVSELEALHLSWRRMQDRLSSLESSTT